MQVFGLPGHVIGNGRAASRLLAAQTPNIEAARRRDAVARWRAARTDGLSADRAARAVGIARATLYRWEGEPAPKSRRPHRVRAKSWTPALHQAVERLRQDSRLTASSAVRLDSTPENAPRACPRKEIARWIEAIHSSARSNLIP
jgi:putative transposase